MRAGTYLRISDDPDGTQTATARQHEDALKYIAQQGWQDADVFEDAGISAYKRNKVRPEYERMIKAVADKQIDVVIAWNIDRLSRQLLPFAQLMDACERAGAFIITLSDHVDTRTQAGQFVATLLVGHAKMSSADTARRIARKHEELVRDGRPILGRRAYGYNQRKTAIVPDEAANIRDAMHRVLAGESLHGVAWDWQRRGILTPTGKLWTVSMLRQVLRSANLSAQRERNGVMTPGCWPAIVTPEETARLRQTLESCPSAVRSQSRAARSYLLTGFVRCGRCNEPLVAAGSKVTGVRKYICSKRPGKRNCGRLARRAADVEQTVRDGAIFMLDSEDLTKYLTAPTGTGQDALIAAIRADEQALEDLTRDHYVDRLIERNDFFAAREPLQHRLDANRATLARESKRGLLHKYRGAGLAVAAGWAELGLEMQRSIIGALVDHVTILPGRSPKYRPELVDITWKF